MAKVKIISQKTHTELMNSESESIGCDRLKKIKLLVKHTPTKI
ncbi:hypothetical protein [Microcoleus anatoxicus]